MERRRRHAGLARMGCLAVLAVSSAAFSQPPTSSMVESEAAFLDLDTPEFECTFNFQGQQATTSAAGAVTTQSVASAAGLGAASISCYSASGADLPISGGSQLAAFSSSFEGVSFTQDNSIPGPAVVINGTSLLITSSTFEDVAAKQMALLVLYNSTLVLNDTMFAGNTGSIAGAIQGNSSNITILDSTFLNNTGTTGALSLLGGSLEIYNSTFSYNSGTQGAIAWVNGTSASLVELILTSNNATSSGGGLYMQNCAGSFTLAEAEITYNTAVQNGGGIFVQQCDGSLLSSDFKHNSAANGGAAFLNAFESLLAMSSNFTGNSATASSGGLQVQSVANATVQGCIFNSNTGSKGAGLYLGTVNGSYTDNYFLSNKAAASGGAFFRTAGTGSITTSSFLANTAVTDGGAIFDSQGTGDIDSNTFSNNTAAEGSGVYRDSCTGAMTGNTGLATTAITEVNMAGATGSSGSSSTPAVPSLWGR